MSEIKPWQRRKKENEGWLPHDDYFMVQEIIELRAALADALSRITKLESCMSHCISILDDDGDELGCAEDMIDALQGGKP